MLEWLQYQPSNTYRRKLGDGGPKTEEADNSYYQIVNKALDRHQQGAKTTATPTKEYLLGSQRTGGPKAEMKKPSYQTPSTQYGINTEDIFKHLQDEGKEDREESENSLNRGSA